jgi:nucleoside phosphorylase
MTFSAIDPSSALAVGDALALCPVSAVVVAGTGVGVATPGDELVDVLLVQAASSATPPSSATARAARAIVGIWTPDLIRCTP